MANSPAAKNLIGIYISPKEISIAQTGLGADGKIEAEHLVKIPTSFKAKEGLLRPLSLNNDFFNEKAPWVEAFQSAVKKVSWGGSRVVVALSPQFAILRYFVMPLVEKRFWSKSIPIESKKYIPVSFDEVVYDYTACPLDDGKKVGVLFGLTQRKSVEFIMNILATVNLELAAVEIAPCSMERLFAFLDPKEHAAKAYIHFSGGSSLMLFSSDGSPVLYREADYEAASTLSERKRLDVKGAVQFVDRYVGGREYKYLMLSGDGVAAWKTVAAMESPMPVELWDPARAAALRENDATSFFSMGASMRGRVPEKPGLDISGISTTAIFEKQARGYVWNIAFMLGGLLMFLSLISQVWIIVLGTKHSAISSQLGNVSELQGGGDLIEARIEKLQTAVKILSILAADTDFLAPKLHAIAEKIPSEFWLQEIQYTGPFAASELQTTVKELKLSGETNLSGNVKQRVVQEFVKSLKTSPEFKIFGLPSGGIEFTIEGSGALAGNYGQERPGLKTTGFNILCTARRII